MKNLYLYFGIATLILGIVNSLVYIGNHKVFNALGALASFIASVIHFHIHRGEYESNEKGINP